MLIAVADVKSGRPPLCERPWRRTARGFLDCRQGGDDQGVLPQIARRCDGNADDHRDAHRAVDPPAAQDAVRRRSRSIPPSTRGDSVNESSRWARRIASRRSPGTSVRTASADGANSRVSRMPLCAFGICRVTAAAAIAEPKITPRRSPPTSGLSGQSRRLAAVVLKRIDAGHRR